MQVESQPYAPVAGGSLRGQRVTQQNKDKEQGQACTPDPLCAAKGPPLTPTPENRPLPSSGKRKE